MRRIIATLAVVLLTAGSLSASEKADVLESIIQFMNALNQGNIQTAVAHCAEEMTIVEYAPEREWQGKKAFSRWLKFYRDDAKRSGIVGLQASLGRLPGDSPIVSISGDAATAVIIVRYARKRDRQPMKEPYWCITCNLLKPTDHWIITLLARSKC